MSRSARSTIWMLPEEVRPLWEQPAPLCRSARSPPPGSTLSERIVPSGQKCRLGSNGTPRRKRARPRPAGEEAYSRDRSRNPPASSTRLSPLTGARARAPLLGVASERGAPSLVAIRRRAAGETTGKRSRTSVTSSHRSSDGEEARLSVPSATRIPRSRSRGRGCACPKWRCVRGQ